MAVSSVSSKTYCLTGITGATIQLDKHGDSEGNYSVVALKAQESQFKLKDANLSCPYSMISVAQFYHSENLVSTPVSES